MIEEAGGDLYYGFVQGVIPEIDASFVMYLVLGSATILKVRCRTRRVHICDRCRRRRLSRYTLDPGCFECCSTLLVLSLPATAGPVLYPVRRSVQQVRLHGRPRRGSLE